MGVVVGFILFMLTFGVEQYYRYHVSNLYSLDGKEHSYYIYPDLSVDSVLNMVRNSYDISGELDLRWHMRLKVFKAPKPGYYVLPAEMGDKLFISKLQNGEQTPIRLKWSNQIHTREELAGKIASQLCWTVWISSIVSVTTSIWRSLDSMRRAAGVCSYLTPTRSIGPSRRTSCFKG